MPFTARGIRFTCSSLPDANPGRAANRARCQVGTSVKPHVIRALTVTPGDVRRFPWQHGSPKLLLVVPLLFWLLIEAASAARASASIATVDARPAPPRSGLVAKKAAARAAIVDIDEALESIGTPMPVRIRLMDGVVLTGVITAWSREGGVMGSFGYRRWSTMRPTEVERLFTRFMDRDAATDWVALGQVMLMHPAGAGLAESAFRRARAIDPDAEGAIEAAHRDAAERARAAEEGDPDRLRLDDPEARLWPVTFWRPMSPDEQKAAVAILREDATTMLTIAGIAPTAPVESDRFMVYGSLPRIELARIALRLERALDRLVEALGADADPPQPWGKILVFLADDRDAFRGLQQRVFLQLDRPDITAMMHAVGGKTAIVALIGPGGDDLMARLAANAGHALMHRYISPVRLPPWANTGVARWLAAQSVPEFPELVMRRRMALRFVREGGNVLRLLTSAYGDPGWPGPDVVGPTFGRSGIGPSVGRIFVELMLKDRPEGFARWVAAVKRGDEWQPALAQEFGVPLRRFVSIGSRWYLTND